MAQVFWNRVKTQLLGNSVQSRSEGFGLTDVGKKRQNNEDAIFVSNSLGLYLVADGMGGHAHGEVASNLAVETIPAQFTCQKKEITLSSLTEAIEEANCQIHKQSKEKVLSGEEEAPGPGGMGTTIVALAITREVALIAHVGDSRLYRMRGHRLEQLTRDHSFSELASSSSIPPAIKISSRFKNIITRALGIDPTVEVEIREEKLEKEDLFLLCSDGLTNMVSDPKIEEILASGDTTKSACQRLIDDANRNGGVDNISCVLIRHR